MRNARTVVDAFSFAISLVPIECLRFLLLQRTKGNLIRQHAPLFIVEWLARLRLCGFLFRFDLCPSRTLGSGDSRSALRRQFRALATRFDGCLGSGVGLGESGKCSVQPFQLLLYSVTFHLQFVHEILDSHHVA